MKILVAFDGTLNSKTCLRYAIEKAKATEGEVIAMHVFNSALFIDYGAGPRAEEIARAESSSRLAEAGKMLAEEGRGIRSGTVMSEGDPEEQIAQYAAENKVDLIISPPGYRSLAKKAACPVSIVPGSILVPIDNTDGFSTVEGLIREEAALTGSKVLLLGIVPIHLYGTWEKAEINRIRKETGESLKKAQKSLAAQGIEAKGIVRSGYPDEEILRVADEYPVTMIYIAETADKPSELVKAAGIIEDEEQQFRKPLCLVPLKSKS